MKHQKKFIQKLFIYFDYAGDEIKDLEYFEIQSIVFTLLLKLFAFFQYIFTLVCMYRVLTID